VGKHNDDVTCISFNAASTLVAATSGERVCRIYRVPAKGSSDASLVKELSLIDPSTKKAYELRGCRFCLSASESAASTVKPKVKDLFLVVANSSARGPSYLAAFDPETWQLVRKIKIDAAPVVVMETSHQGHLVAVATNRSSIFIYRTSDLKLVTSRRECHDLVVTGMSFRIDDSELVSVSADRSWMFTPVRRSGNAFVRMLLFSLIVAVLAYFLQGYLATRQFG